MEKRGRKLVEVKIRLADAEAPKQVVLTDEEKQALKREKQKRRQLSDKGINLTDSKSVETDDVSSVASVIVQCATVAVGLKLQALSTAPLSTKPTEEMEVPMELEEGEIVEPPSIPIQQISNKIKVVKLSSGQPEQVLMWDSSTQVFLTLVWKTKSAPLADLLPDRQVQAGDMESLLDADWELLPMEPNLILNAIIQILIKGGATHQSATIIGWQSVRQLLINCGDTDEGRTS